MAGTAGELCVSTRRAVARCAGSASILPQPFCCRLVLGARARHQSCRAGVVESFRRAGKNAAQENRRSPPPKPEKLCYVLTKAAYTGSYVWYL